MKRLNAIINTVMGSFIGVWIGGAIFKYLDFKKRPDLYAMTSTSWYLSILVTGIALLIVLIICIIIKMIIRKQLNRES